ncbi:hypothetical protein NB713_003478 [Xanthomonas sacchari]|nr:hypothetical protein [Xanthomonas sacchari]
MQQARRAALRRASVEQRQDQRVAAWAGELGRQEQVFVVRGAAQEFVGQQVGHRPFAQDQAFVGTAAAQIVDPVRIGDTALHARRAATEQRIQPQQPVADHRRDVRIEPRQPRMPWLQRRRQRKCRIHTAQRLRICSSTAAPAGSSRCSGTSTDGVRSSSQGAPG